MFATSPMAWTCSSQVRSRASVRMPLSTTRPAASASSTFGSHADADDEEVDVEGAAVAEGDGRAVAARA